ncbi:protein of unknown function [Pseudomonas marincola]|uniref:Uncharacterized protein n=1 Tax=Pseudomonas marincola TaxID=437900 RepID=A0A8S2BM85_9PSED|nr:protein of unknown function [Pseudomonas marincola]
MVASDRPIAVSIFLDTPMKGHRPRNCTNTKLFTRMALTRIRASSVIAGTVWTGKGRIKRARIIVKLALADKSALSGVLSAHKPSTAGGGC